MNRLNLHCLVLKERYESTSDDEYDDVYDNDIYEHVADDEFNGDDNNSIYDHVTEVIDYDVIDVVSSCVQ